MLPSFKEESGLSVLSLETGETHPAHPSSSDKVSVRSVRMPEWIDVSGGTGEKEPPVAVNPRSQCFPSLQAREQGKIV